MAEPSLTTRLQQRANRQPGGTAHTFIDYDVDPAAYLPPCRLRFQPQPRYPRTDTTRNVAEPTLSDSCLPRVLRPPTSFALPAAVRRTTAAAVCCQRPYGVRTLSRCRAPDLPTSVGGAPVTPSFAGQVPAGRPCVRGGLARGSPRQAAATVVSSALRHRVWRPSWRCGSALAW